MAENNKFTEFFKRLGNAKAMVLSTSYNDEVTSRTVSVIILNNKFYFQTDKTSLKFQQLKNNPNAALCFDDIQLQGVATAICTPKENPEFCSLYQKHFPSAFRKYTFLQNETLVEFKPTYAKNGFMKTVFRMKKSSISNGKSTQKKNIKAYNF